MVKKATPHAQTNGVTDAVDDYVGSGPDHTMIFAQQDVTELDFKGFRFNHTNPKALNGKFQSHAPPPLSRLQANNVSQGVSSGFRTDTDISGNLAGRERELQKWEPSADTTVDLSLEESGPGWDQFETNQRLYGVETDYDESYYTTTIDKNNPRYKQIAAEAERIAREIEGSSAMNAHVAEERGIKPLDDSGIDEEMKSVSRSFVDVIEELISSSRYSGVTRNTDFPPLPAGQPNKYTPPARRPPTGQPGVPGVPVDPAIISSSLARPDAKKLSSEEKSSEVTKAQLAEPVETSVESNDEKQQQQEPEKQETDSSSAAQSTTEKLPAVTTANKVSPTTATSSTDKTSNKEGGAAATVEKDVYNAFKQFNQGEKMRIQDHQRKMARQDKAVKLNDLKKFAENFKLHTPVPQDLVPILAKEKSKQDEIVQKALQQVQELKVTPAKPSTSTTPQDQKAVKPTAPRTEAGGSSPLGPQDRQNQQRARPNQPNFSQSVRGERPYQNQIPNIPPRQGPGHLSQRLSITQQQHQQHRAGMAALAGIQQPMPIDPRIPPTGPSASSSGVQSPTGTSRFNVKAVEFRPNPAANTFQPSSNPSTGSSPAREPSVRPTEPKPPKRGNYFEGRRPKVNDRPNIDFDKSYSPLVRMKEDVKAQGKSAEFESNGGIPQAYRTGPTWDIPVENQEKTYEMIFEALIAPSVSPQHPGLGPSPMPHQHQLPLHLQQGAPMPQVHTPQHTPRHLPVQPHHGGPGGPHHMDDHRMQFTGSTSSVQPSPRPMQPYLAYTNQGPQPIPVYQGTVPAYSVSPGGQPMAMRQVSGGHQTFIAPQGPAMGGHMMTNQPSSGPYMNMPMGPQMQMYSPVPGQVYPQHGGPLPPQPGLNGYPSPRPPATLMAHQGSQGGHPAQQMLYMQAGHNGPPLLGPGAGGPRTTP